MATTTSITTTYAGQFAGKYISAALLSGKTLDQGNITIRPNIKYKEVVKKLSLDDSIFDSTCDFNPTSTVTLTENILQPKELQVNLQLCKKDFRSDWEAIEMGVSAFDNLPPTFQDYLLGYVAGKVGEKTEQNIWSGSGLVSGQFSSFHQLFTAGGSGCVSVTNGAAGNVTGSATVIQGIDNILAAVPDTVYGKEDLVIYVSTATMKAYQKALGGGSLFANGYQNQTVVGLKPMDYLGVPLVHAPGLPAKGIVAAQKSNLFFGTGLLSDHNEVKLLDMADLDGSQNVRVIMRYTAGVQFGIGSEIVYSFA